MLKVDSTLAQQIVNTVKDVCQRNINYINHAGIIIASTDESRIGTYHDTGLKAIKSGRTIEATDNNPALGVQKGVNLPIHYKDTIVSAIGISGPPDEVRKYAYLAERITGLLIREQELGAYSRTQAEKIHFVIQSLIKQELSDPDYLQACLTELKINLNTEKRILIIHLRRGLSADRDVEAEQGIRQLFQTLNTRMYTHHYPNDYLAMVEDSMFKRKTAVLSDFAAAHRPAIDLAAGKKSALYQLSESYKSGLAALRSLNMDKQAEETRNNYAVYDELKLELLLSEVSPGNQTAFLEKTIKALTDEEKQLLTIYFDSGLSLAKTCEQLFIHKNTLQYRLNTIHKKSSLNPREFQDGVLLYLALKFDYPTQSSV